MRFKSNRQRKAVMAKLKIIKYPKYNAVMIESNYGRVMIDKSRDGEIVRIKPKSGDINIITFDEKNIRTNRRWKYE